jgi:AAA domain
MAIIYRSTSPASAAATRSIDWVDKGRRQAFSHYLQSIGLDPVVADVIDPADFCRTRDAAWEEVIRQIRGHAPDPDPNVHVREIINRLGRLAGKQPTPGHELDDILDDIDLSERSDEDRFPFFTPARLNSGQFETRYLIDGVLAAGQPGGIFGAFKTLKTSVTADLLISLASGTPFLGQFPVAQPGPTLFLSGESGLAALQSIVRRICRARGLALEAVDNFELSPKLPQFDRAADLRALRRIIRERQPICVAIDPAYLAVGGDATHNLFAMGALLRPLAEICQTTGCTVLVVHHCKRSQQSGFARGRRLGRLCRVLRPMAHPLAPSAVRSGTRPARALALGRGTQRSPRVMGPGCERRRGGRAGKAEVEDGHSPGLDRRGAVRGADLCRL